MTFSSSEERRRNQALLEYTSQKALRIDVDVELGRAFRLRRSSEPVAQMGREVEGARTGTLIDHPLR
jgi:hypothetical protein